MAARLAVRSVYKVSGFGLLMLRKSYRVSSFDRMLSLTPATQFDLITTPSPTFVPTAFEFVHFENLISRCPPCPFLTDLTGQAVSISDPEYVDATHGIALTQAVVLRATTSARLTVTLWDDFAKVLDPSVLAIEDASSPVVIAFGGLIVW
ncbi:hypothetical protein LINGRAHAP2_LOCUS7997, partial [Linum grandiflorum]